MTMNVDEALMMADEIIGSSGVAQALHVLAAEVRRQHADLTAAQEELRLCQQDAIGLQDEVSRLRSKLDSIGGDS